MTKPSLLSASLNDLKYNTVLYYYIQTINVLLFPKHDCTGALGTTHSTTTTAAIYTTITMCAYTDTRSVAIR